MQGGLVHWECAHNRACIKAVYQTISSPLSPFLIPQRQLHQQLSDKCRYSTQQHFPDPQAINARHFEMPKPPPYSIHDPQQVIPSVNQDGYNMASQKTSLQSILSENSTRPRFRPSTDTVPDVYVVVPLPEEPSYPIVFQKARIIPLCQGPSLVGRRDDPFHMTSHRGYAFQRPKRIAMRPVVRGVDQTATRTEAAGGAMIKVSNSPVTLLSEFIALKSGCFRIYRTGINPKIMLVPQVVMGSYQKKAMKELLRMAVTFTRESSITGGLKGIVLGDGRTIWVCNQCHDCLQRDDPIETTDFLTISQYRPLVKRDPEVEVTLTNATSVIVFAETFTKPSKTTKIVIHIEPRSFETPEQVADPRNSPIVNLFNNLGRVLKRQKALKHLEIYGDATTNGEQYIGLQAVLKCPSLETLHISGIPCFLQGEKISIKSKSLKEFTSQGVLVDTAQAANNLGSLVL